jgi:hypothetical protein
MNSNIVEVFLHGTGRPVVIAAEADEVLRDFLARNDALPRDGEFVYVGESRQARDNPDLGEDEHLPADLDLTIVQLELPSKRHVHTHAVHSIRVTVEFNAQTPTRRFSPNATVDTVLVWAKHRLNIDPVAGADLVLELVPSAEIPRMDEYLGDLLSAGQHELKFKLVKEVNPQGACA